MFRNLFYAIYVLTLSRSILASDVVRSTMPLSPACNNEALSAYRLDHGGENKDQQGAVFLLGDRHGDKEIGKQLLSCFQGIKRDAKYNNFNSTTFTENMLSLTHEYHFPLWDSIPDHERGHEIIQNSFDFVDYILFMFNVDISPNMNKKIFSRHETKSFYMQFARLIEAKMRRKNHMKQKWRTYKMLGECNKEGKEKSINQCLYHLKEGHRKTSNKIKVKLLLKTAHFLRKENPSLFLKLFAKNYRSAVIDIINTIESCEINKNRNQNMARVISDDDSDITVVFAGARHMFGNPKHIECGQECGNPKKNALKLLTSGADPEGTRLQKLQSEIRTRAEECLLTQNHVPKVLKSTKREVYFILKKGPIENSYVPAAGFWKKVQTPSTCTRSLRLCLSHLKRGISMFSINSEISFLHTEL